MKVSSLAKDETLYLLDLYKQLQQVEEQLDSYIENTAIPEVSNIKKAIDTKQKTDTEATEILNSSSQIKDTKKMISLLEEYIDSSNEIETSNEKSRQIMYVIDELIDKKNSIEEEIKSLESSNKIEKNYDKIDKILPKDCKIINCDGNLKNNIISEYNSKIKVFLNRKEDNITEELIRIVENHINDKEKEEAEKLKIVQMENDSLDETNEENVSIEKIIDLDNKVSFEEEKIEEPTNVINISEPVSDNYNEEPEQIEEKIDEIISKPEDNIENVTIENNSEPAVDVIDDGVSIEKPQPVNEKVDEILFKPEDNVENVPAENNYTPISDIINGNVSETTVEEPINNIDPLDKQLEELGNNPVNKSSEEENIKYIGDDVQDKKIAKVPSHKREKVFASWEGTFKIPTIKHLDIVDNEEKITTEPKVENGNIVSFDSFVTGKTA